jgi:hypothetical protein
MKKILLLIVSGLLLACTAGSAMAFNLDLLNGPDLDDASVTDDLLELQIGKSLDIYLKVIPDPVNDGPRDFRIYINKVDEHGMVIDNAPVYITASPEVLEDIDVGQPSDFVVQTPIRLTTLPGAVDGDVYRVTADGDDVGVEVTTHVTTIPEFPTVALPVAAILGLVFIFGRKKEGL